MPGRTTRTSAWAIDGIASRPDRRSSVARVNAFGGGLPRASTACIAASLVTATPDTSTLRTPKAGDDATPQVAAPAPTITRAASARPGERRDDARRWAGRRRAPPAGRTGRCVTGAGPSAVSRLAGAAARRSTARATIRAHRSGNARPAAAATRGKRLIGVKPGIVLISLR